MKYVGVALVAGTVGALVALLIAPQSGEETRRQIRKRVRREKEMLAKKGRRALEDAEEYMHDRLADGRRVVDDVTDRVADSLQSGRKRVTRLVRS